MHKQWIKDGLSEYLSDAHAVWHMPGHKRKACYGDFQDAFLAWDVTEVPGTDDLYLPEGFIGDSLAMLKEIYQTCGTYYVVNGATGGIFTAIAACTKPGDADPDCKKLPQIGLQCGGDAAATDDLCGADMEERGRRCLCIYIIY